MKNAEKFKEIFKEFATEVWAFPEKDFLTWLNAEYEEPTTKNDLGVDAISRQALLNATVKKSSIWNHITDSEGNNLETIISNLPSVTPQEPRKGHWIFKQFDEETGILNNYWCSECGKPLAQVYKTYCSNCGAKMVEPQESEKTK